MTEQQSWWLIAFVGITAVAFLIQALAVFGIFVRFKKLTGLVNQLLADLNAKVEGVTGNVNDILEAVKPIPNHIASISVALRDRVEELDKFIGETTEAARLQVAKIDDVVSTSIVKFDDTLTTLQKSVVNPVIEITALLKGVKTGLEFLFRKPRTPDISQARQDEEMFI
ncbi:MAG: hypothetical protein HY652_14555 [Acidobacteria bacterium]|nr:hypothetical protein [Acidobacteriota bacterium]